TVADSHLIIQRSQIKRSKPNVFPQYWDIPGGRVEENELPRDAAVRECYEETGISIAKENLTIIHEDSQFDEEKQTVFTRLVYEVTLPEQPKTILLDPEEHTDFIWFT
ncbi:NUDIX hydrolase, partial [Streptococcus suis]